MCQMPSSWKTKDWWTTPACHEKMLCCRNIMGSLWNIIKKKKKAKKTKTSTHPNMNQGNKLARSLVCLHKSALLVRNYVLRKIQSLSGCTSRNRKVAKRSLAKAMVTAHKTMTMHAIMVFVRKKPFWFWNLFKICYSHYLIITNHISWFQKLFHQRRTFS